MIEAKLSVTATRNGSSVAVVGGNFSYELATATGSWSLELAKPIIPAATDKWTISYSLAGKTWNRIKDCTATISGADTLKNSTRKIQGVYQGDTYRDILDYCLPKTLCFVNKEWLKLTFPDAQIKDNMVCTTNNWQGGQNFGAQRIFHPRLPPKEMEEGTFLCIFNCSTHHAIAKYLARLINYEIQINTPDFTILDTCTINSGTTWIEAIKKNFTFLGAEIRVEPKAGTGKPVIRIIDVLSKTANAASPQVISIDPKACVSVTYSTEQKNAGRSDKVDHCIITGRTAINSTTKFEDMDLTPKDIAGKSYTITDWIETEVKPTDPQLLGIKIDALRTFGIPPDDYSIDDIATVYIKTGYHKYRDFKGSEHRIIVEQWQEPRTSLGKSMGKTHTINTYGDDYKLVKTVQEDYAVTNMPGTSEIQEHLLATTVTAQDRFVKPLKLRLTSETKVEKIVYDKVPKGGTTYNDNPNPMMGLLRVDKTRTSIDNDADTIQAASDIVTHVSKQEIDRNSSSVLLQRKTDYDVLSNQWKCDTTLLDNPLPQPETSTDQQPFRKEYKNGRGKFIGTMECFHSPVTVNHEDISTERQAEMVRDRIFARKSEDTNQGVKVAIALPLPLFGTAFKMVLGSYSKMVDGASMNIPSKNYVLRGIDENFSISGGRVDFTQTLTGRTKP